MTTPDPRLSAADRSFLDRARRAVLATIGADGQPRLVPICFVVDPARPVLFTPLDEKPKTVRDLRRLARVRDIEGDARVSILVDHWDEDWRRLAWLRLLGRAVVLKPAAASGSRAETDERVADDVAERAEAIEALRARYAQYEAHALERLPLIRITIDRVTRWGELGG